MRFTIVKKFQHERMLRESAMHDSALDAAASAVNEPDVTQAVGVRLCQIFADERGDVLRRERVEVERWLDW